MATAVPGRPLAAAGLDITTVRPRWSISTRATRDPANPTVSITFGRSGNVIRAEITRGSGFADVDGPLLTAIYRWTAKGEPLRRLPPRSDTAEPEPGVTITLRVMLR
jgi:hypothetical protein